MTAYDITLLVREFSDSEVFALNRISSVIKKSHLVAVDEFAENLKDPSHAPEDRQLFLEAVVRLSHDMDARILPLRCHEYKKQDEVRRWSGFMGIPYVGEGIACYMERCVQSGVIYRRLDENRGMFCAILQPYGELIIKQRISELVSRDGDSFSFILHADEDISEIDAITREFDNCWQMTLNGGFPDIFCGKKVSVDDHRDFRSRLPHSMVEDTRIRDLDRRGECKGYFYI